MAVSRTTIDATLMARDAAVTSRIMSAVRNRGGAAELAIRRRLWANGLRYRVRSRLHGRPDLVFPGARLAIFIDGDLWHGNSWRVRGLPSLEAQFPTRTEWWVAKIRRNMQRDLEVNALLRAAGWTVLRYWESAVLEDPNGVAREIAERVHGRPLADFVPIETSRTERRRRGSVRGKGTSPDPGA